MGRNGDIQIIKKGYSRDRFTSAQYQELAMCMTDPIYFIEKYMMIQHAIHGRVPFKMYPFQHRIIKAMHEHRFSVVLTARQSGKTTCAAGYLLWKAMFCQDATILLAANKFSQAMEIMDRIRFAYENLEQYNWLRAGVIEYNKGTIAFDNGSRIISRATTPDAGRGLAITCVSIKNTIITVKNTITNEIKELTISELLKLQNIIDNSVKKTNFKVLTINGYKDFDGYLISKKQTWLLKFDNTTIECTRDHKFYSITRNKWIQAISIKKNEYIRTLYGSTKFLNKEKIGIQEVVDLINVKDTHSFIANGLDAHNCLYLDEFAFVQPRMAEEFWTGMLPTLSTGGQAILTSTPNSDEDQFAQIWHGANENFDDTGNEIPGGVGRNGFFPVKVTWEEHPDRDGKWAIEHRMKLGEEKFRREFSCVKQDSKLNLSDSQNNYFTSSIGDLYRSLLAGDK